MMRLHVIDGTFELFRATSPNGRDRHRPTARTSRRRWGHGIGVAVIEDDFERATHLAVAFDNPIESFRNDLFAATRRASAWTRS